MVLKRVNPLERLIDVLKIKSGGKKHLFSMDNVATVATVACCLDVAYTSLRSTCMVPLTWLGPCGSERNVLAVQPSDGLL